MAFDPLSIVYEPVVNGPTEVYVIGTGNSLTYFDLDSIPADAITIAANAGIYLYPKATYHVIGDVAAIGVYKGDNNVLVISKEREEQFKKFTDRYVKVNELMEINRAVYKGMGSGFVAMCMAYILYARIPTLTAIHYVGLDYSFYRHENCDYSYTSKFWKVKNTMPIFNWKICTPKGIESKCELMHVSKYGDYMGKVGERRGRYVGQNQRCIQLVRSDPWFAELLKCRSHFDLTKGALSTYDYNWRAAQVSAATLKGASNDPQRGHPGHTGIPG